MTIPPYLSYNVRNRDPFSKKLHLPGSKLPDFVKKFNFFRRRARKSQEIDKKNRDFGSKCSSFCARGVVAPQIAAPFGFEG